MSVFDTHCTQLQRWNKNISSYQLTSLYFVRNLLLETLVKTSWIFLQQGVFTYSIWDALHWDNSLFPWNLIILEVKFNFHTQLASSEKMELRLFWQALIFSKLMVVEVIKDYLYALCSLKMFNDESDWKFWLLMILSFHAFVFISF